MKWIRNRNSLNTDSYELLNGDKKLLQASIDHSYGSLSILKDDTKRRFIIEQRSKTSTVLRNEYGIRLAQLKQANAFEGAIVVDGQSFQYRFQSPGTILVSFHTKEKIAPEIIGELQVPHEGTRDHNFAILLLTWIWNSVILASETSMAF
jgi:hypothetical protein